MKAQIIRLLLLILFTNLFAKGNALRGNDPQRFVEQIFSNFIGKCESVEILKLSNKDTEKMMTNVNTGMRRFYDITLQLDKKELCSEKNYSCFSLPKDAPDLKEWSHKLGIPLRFREDGRVPMAIICEICEEMLRKNIKLEIDSNSDLKQIVARAFEHHIKSVLPHGIKSEEKGVESWASMMAGMKKKGKNVEKSRTREVEWRNLSHSEGIYELDIGVMEMGKLLESMDKIFTYGLDAEDRKICEHLYKSEEMFNAFLKIQSDKIFNEYAKKAKENLGKASHGSEMLKVVNEKERKSLENCSNDIFSLLLIANFLRAAERGKFVDERISHRHQIEEWAKNWFRARGKGKIIKFYEEEIAGKLILDAKEKERRVSFERGSSSRMETVDVDKSIKASSSSSSISPVSMVRNLASKLFSRKESASKEEMAIEILEFNVNLSLPSAYNFYKLIEKLRSFFDKSDRLTVCREIHENFHIFADKKWTEIIYEKLKLAAQKAFTSFEGEEKEFNCLYEVLMLGASAEIAKGISGLAEMEKYKYLKKAIVDRFAKGNIEDSPQNWAELKNKMFAFSELTREWALGAADHLADHKLDKKIWENFIKNVLVGKFHVSIMEAKGDEEIEEVNIQERGTPTRRWMSDKTEEMFEKVDWNKKKESANSFSRDDFNLHTLTSPDSNKKGPLVIRLSPVRMSRLLKGIVKLTEAMLAKWKDNNNEADLCTILHPKKEKERKGETVYPAYKALVDILRVDGFHDLEHGIRDIEVAAAKENIGRNKKDPRSTSNCKLDLALVRAYLELAMSIHYSIDYQTLSDRGAIARQIICEKGDEYCDYPERIEKYRIEYGKLIRVLDIWLEELENWDGFADKNVHARFAVQILGTPPPRWDMQMGKYKNYIHPHLGLVQYCWHIIEVGKGKITNLSAYNFPAALFFSPIDDLKGVAAFAQTTPGFNVIWESYDDAKSFYKPMEEIRKIMVDRAFFKKDLCQMLHSKAADPMQKLLKLKLVEEDFKYLRGAVQMYLHLPKYDKNILPEGDNREEIPDAHCIYDAIILQGAVEIMQNTLEVMEKYPYIKEGMVGKNPKPDIPTLMASYNKMTEIIQRGLGEKSKQEKYKFDPKAWDVLSVQLVWGKFHAYFKSWDNQMIGHEKKDRKRPISMAELLKTKMSSVKNVHFGEKDDGTKEKGEAEASNEIMDEEEGIALEWTYKDAADFFILTDEIKKDFEKFDEGEEDLCTFLHKEGANAFWGILKYEKTEGMFEELRKVAKNVFNLKMGYKEAEDAEDLAKHSDMENCIYDFAIWRSVIYLIETLSLESKTKKDIEKRVFNGRNRNGLEIGAYLEQSSAIQIWMSNKGIKEWKKFQTKWIKEKIHLKLEDSGGWDEQKKEKDNQKGGWWKGKWGKGGNRRNRGGGRRRDRYDPYRGYGGQVPTWGPGEQDDYYENEYHEYNNVGPIGPIPGGYGAYRTAGIPPHAPKPVQPTAAANAQPAAEQTQPTAPAVPHTMPQTPIAHLMQPNGQMTSQSMNVDPNGRGHTYTETGKTAYGGIYQYLREVGQQNNIPIQNPMAPKIPIPNPIAPNIPIPSPIARNIPFQTNLHRQYLHQMARQYPHVPPVMPNPLQQGHKFYSQMYRTSMVNG